MGTIGIIGDMGGHLDQIREGSVCVGARSDAGDLPPEVTIIQGGDLIHRGPDSHGVLDFVEDRLMASTAGDGEWVQLIGNHEGHYLGGPQFLCEDIDEADVARLRTWHREGLMRVAVAVATERAEILVTHAGLTAGAWEQLGAPRTAGEAAAALNDPANWAVVSKAGWMLGEPVDHAAGPLWAQCAREVYDSLAVAAERGRPVPFSQVHGHSSAHRWGRRVTPPASHAGPWQLDVDSDRKITTTTIGGHTIWGIDPQLGVYGHSRWSPLVIDGQITGPPVCTSAP